MKKGIAASGGYAIGEAFIKQLDDVILQDNEEEKTINAAEEKEKLQLAIENSKKQLMDISEKTKNEIGNKEAEIFDSQFLLLEDPEFTGAVFSAIETSNMSAKRALNEVINNYLEMFAGIDDEYIRERAEDIKDVGMRILKNLLGKVESAIDNLKENTIIVAHDLTPSDTAQIDKNKVIGILTDIGGRTSHSAIVARTLEIPAVVGLQDITSSVKTGDKIIIDGNEGNVIINPDEDTLALYLEKIRTFEAEKAKLKKLVSTKTITKSGKSIIIAANIGSPKDLQRAIENGAEGVGLFRTEFLYMNRDTLPTEEEQFSAYKYVAENMEGKPVVIRTLDIGGDKKLPCMPLPEEMNPFLGYRAIRLCLDKTDIFKTQLRAILRASAFGYIQVMFPMISSLDEFLKAKELLNECKEELKSEGKAYNDKIETGIMVEIPSAAIMADELAKYVDFFSIGTNDLIQYTLAADRMNQKVSYLYNPMHPAVLRLIKMTIDAAHKEGKWCGMCGEMAGDENAMPTLLKYGLDEFSMSASSILKARKLAMS